MSAALANSCMVALLVAAVAACSSASGTSGAQTSGNADSSVPTFNGCAPDAFVTSSSPAVVNFGGASGSPLFGYAPPCIRVAAGASVSFLGDFSVHPMSPGTSPEATTAGSANNPIPAKGTGTSLRVTFPLAGTFPYFCQMHYAAGMAGVVLVQ
jgi:plastocyanin